MKILVVDDSKTMRSMQRSILVQLGHKEIQEASDGLDALSKLAMFEPELLLVGRNMPNMDGITFVKEYRANGGNAPIMMVTAESEKTLVIEAIKAGVNNYVVKPFTPDLLSQRIEETISKMAA